MFSHGQRGSLTCCSGRSRATWPRREINNQLLNVIPSRWHQPPNDSAGHPATKRMAYPGRQRYRGRLLFFSADLAFTNRDSPAPAPQPAWQWGSPCPCLSHRLEVGPAPGGQGAAMAGAGDRAGGCEAGETGLGRQGGRQGGREGGRERGREGDREAGREGGRCPRWGTGATQAGGGLAARSAPLPGLSKPLSAALRAPHRRRLELHKSAL